jgi:hypothetical protein
MVMPWGPSNVWRKSDSEEKKVTSK